MTASIASTARAARPDERPLRRAASRMSWDLFIRDARCVMRENEHGPLTGLLRVIHASLLTAFVQRVLFGVQALVNFLQGAAPVFNACAALPRRIAQGDVGFVEAGPA